MTKKPAQAKRPDPYPSAPTDPAQRREFVSRRNARIQGVPYDEYVKGIEDQNRRRQQFAKDQAKQRNVRD